MSTPAFVYLKLASPLLNHTHRLVDLTHVVQLELERRSKQTSCREEASDVRSESDSVADGPPSQTGHSIIVGDYDLELSSVFDRRLAIAGELTHRLRKAVYDQLQFTVSAGVLGDDICQ